MAKPSAKAMWQPTIPVNQGIFEDNSAKQAALGTRLEVGDRVFYYAQCNAALTPGEVISHPAQSAEYSNNVQTCGTAVAAATALAYFFTDTGSVGANAFEDGYIGVGSGDGAAGYLYRIKSNLVAAASAGCKCTLYDPLDQALTATHLVSAVTNIYKNVYPTTSDNDPTAGIAPCDVTANHYFWLQTWGPAMVDYGAAAPTNNYICAESAGLAKVLHTTGILVTANETIIGKAYGQSGTDTQHGIALIQIRA